MADHAWCHDVARDAAVRAAEDGRTGPLPTLGECIDGMFPKSVSPTSAPEQENKGDGMRTERVTLEVTGAPGWRVHLIGIDVESVRVVEEEERQAPPTTKPATTENDYVPPAPVSRPAETRQTKAERIGGGWWFPKYDKPSAPPPPPPAPPRVHRGSGVFDASGDEVPWEGVVAALTAERDAAIRERDHLEARVADLQSASGGGEGEAVASTWQHEASDGILALEHILYVFREDERPTVRHRIEKVRRLVEVYRHHIVNLYRSPTQPRGWLTEDEREAVQWAADAAYDKQHPAEDALRSVLARSSPPEVDLPISLSPIDEELVRASLRRGGLRCEGGGA